jgi:thymidylate synthase
MRSYTTFTEALNEIKRDVAELGSLVHPQTMQDKAVADDPAFLTKEYLNLTYAVTRPRLEDLSPTQPWADAEFEERIAGVGPEDGDAWRLRPDVWTEYAERGLGYSYGERLELSLEPVIKELQVHPDSRQLFLAIWNPAVDPGRLGRVRVPCSLGYWVVRRNQRLYLTYFQRSADIAVHLDNDVYLAHRLQRYIAEAVGTGVGTYTHWIGSCHAYAKDVAGIF